MAAWLILVTFAALVAVFALWPVAETVALTARNANADTPASYPTLHLPMVDLTLSPAVTILMLAVLFGVLGSLVHTLTRLTQSSGGKVSKKTAPSRREALWYMANPVQGGLLAMLVVAAIQAGLLTGGASTSVAPVNLFTIAAVAGATGLFSKRMTTKLAGLVNAVNQPAPKPAVGATIIAQPPAVQSANGAATSNS